MFRVPHFLGATGVPLWGQLNEIVPFFALSPLFVSFEVLL